MADIETKGIRELLLSPLFLLNYVLGTIAPGALLLLLLGLKGNVILRNQWLSPLFGHKTKVAIFLLVAYVLGSVLRALILWTALILRLIIPKQYFQTEESILSPWLKNKSPQLEKMVNAVLTDGVVHSSPSLIDRLSHSQTDAVFHVATGAALIVASFIPGDGSLRSVEAILGLGMLLSGFLKSHRHQEMTLGPLESGLRTFWPT